MATERSIKNWMRKNATRFIDDCGELNCTLMVETFDHEMLDDGEETLDSDHAAWSIAIDVGEELARLPHTQAVEFARA